jgi:hypothetical protein
MIAPACTLMALIVSGVVLVLFVFLVRMLARSRCGV